MAIQFFQTANFANSVTATSFVKSGGTSSQYLMADGSVSTGSSSIAWADITSKPTTISGFGITDAFDGAYSSLTGTPTIPTDFVSKASGGTFGGSIKITSGVGGKLHLRSTDTAIVDGDYIGNLYFEGVDSGGAADSVGASIHAIADGTWSNTVAPTELIFKTRNTTGGTTTALTLNKDQSATFAGAVTINKNGDALNLRSTTNAVKPRITFSSDVPDAQIGHIEYSHSNSASYGSGESFVIGGTETDMTILADGKLMYKEGIYSKPASGTGAGTRKDANWDTAYTHSQSAHFSGSYADLTNVPSTFAPSAHNHAASEITSGTFDTARIPSLAASKITSGTFTTARIPNLAASKITSGTFAAARIAHNSFDIGDTTPETGRSVHETGIYTFNRNNGTLGTGTESAYYSVLAWGQGGGGSAQIAAKWTGTGDKLYYRSLRDTTDDWWNWKEIYHTDHKPTWSEIASKPSTFAPSAHNQAWTTITSTPTTLAGYGITDAAASNHNHDGTYVKIGATHTASSVTRFQSNNTIDTGSGSQSPLEVYQDNAGHDAFMTFHVSGDYAAYFGLDGASNDFVFGGWSKGAVKQRVFHDGYHPNADGLTTSRTFTVGNTGKQFDGTGDVSWTLAEIGAAAAGDENIIDGATSIWNADGDGDVFKYSDANPTHNGDGVGAVIDITGDGSELHSLVRAGIYTGDHISVSRGYYVGSILNTTNANTQQVITAGGDFKVGARGYELRSGSITVNGDANTYYPVTWYGGYQAHYHKIQIHRNYNETAPNSWNTSSHKGGLLLDLEANWGGWGGVYYDVKINEFSETYSNMVGGISHFANSRGFAIWLRGGGAVYHFSTQGINADPAVQLSAYDPGGNSTGVSSRTTIDTAFHNRHYYRTGTLYSQNSQVLTVANEGSGNGIDADTVDGYHESTFARKDANADIDMNNYNINYVGQVHFQDNVRFYDDGNDNYLNFRWGDTGAGGMRFRDGDYHVNGTVYGSGDQFGLLDADGSWAVRIQNNSAVDLRVNNSSRLICDSGGTEFRNGGTIVGEVTTAGLARFASDVVAYYSFSDQRLKTDIKATTNNLDKILKLEPVEYIWKDGGREGKKEIGLIAQDVEKVIPEVVRENERLNDDTLYKQVDYEHLVSTLIGAIQEQQDQIAELKSEVTNLKSTMCKCKN